MDKGQLRLELKKRVSAIPLEQRSLKSKKACHNLVATSQFEDALVVMMYLSLADEVDTSEAILCAWQKGKKVVVPKVFWREGHMVPVEIKSLEGDFSVGVSGVRNPTSGIPVPFEQIDLVVAPGLGFDAEGNRLGRGGAYYDRFFATKGLKATRCGLAFTEQFVGMIPATRHDECIDFLVTDEQVIYFNGG